MRLRLLASLVAVLLAVGAGSATALPVDTPVITSDNVTLVTTLPEAVGAISMQFASDKPVMYLSTLKGIHTYDVSDPRAPRRLGYLPMLAYQNEAMSLGERPNGEKFLLVASNGAVVTTGGFTDTSNRAVVVVDVTDPGNPREVAARQVDTRTHTVSCGTPSCEYAYSDGRSQGRISIIDLTDFRNPKMAGTYASVVPSGHDQDLDDAGVLWHVGGQGAVALDISNPTAPVQLNSTDRNGLSSADYSGKPWNNFILHNSYRPNARAFDDSAVDADGRPTSGSPSLARGNVLLVTEEDYVNTGGGRCGDFEGSFQTWHVPYLDAGRYAQDNPSNAGGGGTITPLDRWNTELLDSGIETPAGAFCSSHYFDYNAPGFVAQGWYQQGTRILDVRDPADIKQVGYFFTGAMETWAAYWVPVRNAKGKVTGRTSNLVYTADAVRGVDVLEVGLPTDKLPKDTRNKRAPVMQEWLAPAPTSGSTKDPDWGWLCRLPSTG